MNLLTENETIIQKTTLSRKLTLNGITKAYPVYKINISALYYNDQNDRIATWISQYKNEYGEHALEKLSREEYNKIIEDFIYKSNPASIEKTKLNIELVGQRESGVVLNDGRIIDGNRRFTCIRKIHESSPEFCWFEAVILDNDINNDKKTIKMLELTIQHGEEKRVDYNHVERLIGVYQDIVETKLLTINEYAISTNESVGEVKKRVESSKMLIEFLEFINMPKQYHIVREYQIVALINDLQEVFKKCTSIEEINLLKEVTYANFLMNVFTDERKYIKNISTMLFNKTFFQYATEMKELITILKERLLSQKPSTYLALKTFVHTNQDLTFEMKELYEKYVSGAKKLETRNKPLQVVGKTIVALKEMDVNIISKLTPIEKEQVYAQITRLNLMIDQIENALGVDTKPKTTTKNQNTEEVEKEQNTYKIVPSSIDEEIEIKLETKTINELFYSVNIKNKNNELTDEYEIFFITKEEEICSDIKTLKITNEFTQLLFELKSKVSDEENIILCIRNKTKNKDKELIKMINIEVRIEFKADFGF